MTITEQKMQQVARRRLTRRGVIVAGAAASILGWLNPFSRQAVASTAEAAVLALLRHRRSAAAIGEAALAAWPELADRGALLAGIGSDLNMSFSDLTRAGVGEIHRLFSERIRMDFTTGRTLKIDGWLLSLAEVRLYALAALSGN